MTRPSTSTLDELARLSASELAGQLLVVGFDGADLPRELERAFARRERAGLIIFRRNIQPGYDGLRGLQELCASAVRASGAGFPPVLAIDEEGGRVARLGPPALKLPPMRQIAERGGTNLVERVAKAVGDELRCLGLSMNFAPVVDVDTNPDNPIIGDRAFSRDPEAVVRHATSYLQGLRAAGIQSCLKHFPGHGDTLLDSHLALPVVSHSAQRLEAVELLPFRHLASLADSMMTAHVMYPALDPARPATLSPIIASDLLRNELGFTGVLFSDDLEMQAIAGHGSVEDSAIAAVSAGCDLLLICSRSELQTRAHVALAHRIEADSTFRARCLVGAARGLEMRRSGSCHPATASELDTLLSDELPRVGAEIRACLESTV